MNCRLLWADLTDGCSSKGWSLNVDDGTEIICWVLVKGRDQLGYVGCRDINKISEFNVCIRAFWSKHKSVLDFDCKSVTGLPRLFCKAMTPISGGKDLENVCDGGIIDDDALRDSSVNTGFMILGVSSCPVKKPSSEGKAGVNGITEGSSKDAESEGSSSVRPDTVGSLVNVADDASWVVTSSWDITSWFRTEDRCWIVSECWVIVNCSVIKHEVGDTSGNSWADGVLFDGGSDCFDFNLELSSRISL